MFFNSLDFALFLPIVFCLYWFVFQKNLRHQNILITVASYVFYGLWDWRFLALIVFSSLVDYFIGKRIYQKEKERTRKYWLWLSIAVNLSLLGFFKYYNFFIDSFRDTFQFFGHDIHLGNLEIILPLGISFYTFQTLSYTIDIYRKKIEPSEDVFAFTSFVSFFPQLVAGPIERASNLLPQFTRSRKFNYSKAVDGLRQILWGLFKKVVIADGCAKYANQIFDNYGSYSGSTLLLGSIFFAFQIYGDFSGYSDIAIGTSKLFGIDLKKNFSFPYFSRDIAEFWRRWHISLTTWFRDYVYIPLGGSRVGKVKQIRNVFLLFLISGFWHGSKWTFVVWGIINALYFLPILLINKNRKNLNIVAEKSKFPSLKELFQISFTFLFTTLSWIFFRSKTVEDACLYLKEIASPSLFSIPEISPVLIILLTVIFVVLEWIGRRNEYAIEKLGFAWKQSYRWFFYLALSMAVLLLAGDPQEFIYFQF
jgi:alginate O-acetyltransferase complex protein AlgI